MKIVGYQTRRFDLAQVSQAARIRMRVRILSTTRMTRGEMARARVLLLRERESARKRAGNLNLSNLETTTHRRPLWKAMVVLVLVVQVGPVMPMLVPVPVSGETSPRTSPKTDYREKDSCGIIVCEEDM